MFKYEALFKKIIWLCLICVLQSCNSPPQPSPSLIQGSQLDSITTPHFESPEYGIQASFWWDPASIEANLTLVNEMEFEWVKQVFAWRDIQGIENSEPDWWRTDLIVNAVEEHELKLLVRIERPPFWAQPDKGVIPLENTPPANFQDFGDFCGLLAKRYKGRISAYQIWNEPNLSREWGERPPNPVEYTDLLKNCYEVIKIADPNAIVISAGLAPTGTLSTFAMPDTEFLKGMYDAGAASYFDVLGVHAPGFKAPPELDPALAADPDEGYGGGRWFAFRHVEDLRLIMLENGDAHKQVAILEMGWILHQEIHAPYTWHGVSEQEQADYLVRAYDYARTHWQPWIGLMTTIYFADAAWTPHDNEQWWWSIVLPDGTPREAYFALRDMPKSQ